MQVHFKGICISQPSVERGKVYFEDYYKYDKKYWMGDRHVTFYKSQVLISKKVMPFTKRNHHLFNSLNSIFLSLKEFKK